MAGICWAPISAWPKRTSCTPGHDRLLAHKDALFSHLVGRWRDLFNVSFDVLLYDLTSTYFEIDAAALPEGAKRRHGWIQLATAGRTARKW